jgi:hypothetical protein
MQIQVSREVPTVSSSGRPPTGEDIQKFSTLQAYDSWVLLQSAAELDQWDQTGLGLGVIATVEVSEPAGGYQTTVLTLTAAVP